ncbi:hypothetical protein U9M48_019127 [Paspalum notatum var. saurae]|uniref:J domain-containing protein n=1 Tax=Paspalum notatum var. saurae TaxID=547442 RepID=A0AAQ3TBQ3_PASNO
MGRDGKETKRHSRKRSRSSDSDSSGFPSSISSPSSSPGRRRCSSKRKRASSSSHRHGHSSKSSGRSSSSRDEERRRQRRRRRDEEYRQRIDDEGGSSSSGSEGEKDRAAAEEAQEIVRDIIREFPAVAGELRQLLQMIDSGEGIDISEISDKPLVKRLKKLFRSLRLKESASGVYLLPTKNVPTLNIVGPLLLASSKLADIKNGKSISPNKEELSPANSDVQNKDKDDTTSEGPKTVDVKEDPPKKRIIGPAMPSRELLAAAAEMTEALKCRDAELEDNDDLLIGPPPPAVVAEAASVNEAERFEEVTRILAADSKSPYDVLGVNWKMPTDNMKKRYWKLSLLVHPDKCPHPSAQEAFVKLNNAFKDLQDPDKRGVIDDNIKKKEEMEQFEIELKAMREAAEWRRLQGVSLEGDDELLAGPKLAHAPKRDEWMTTLPPERKAGVPMHSTTFSMNGKEGRGDTSVWTDTPLDRAQKAQQSYLDAYNKTKAIAEGDDVKSKSPNASIVDKYNTSKRSVSLVQKHRESKKEKRKQKQLEKEEWEGNHPWKPWDREKDLSAGRQKVALDPESMSQGLSSRFASGAVQRNFL